MKRIRQCLSMLLVLALLLTCAPLPALAAEPNEVHSAQGVQVNPISKGTNVAQGGFVSLKTDVPFSEYLTTYEEVALRLRECMKNREASFTFYLRTTNDSPQGIIDIIWEKAMEHTGNPVEGDYILRQYDTYKWYTEWDYSGEYIYYVYQMEFTYLTTADQETRMDEAVAAFFDEEVSISDSMTDYEKLRIIYDWVAQNVYYDYDHPVDYMVKHSAYAALVDRLAVCQGYAALMYRLLLSVGIDNRMVYGFTDSGEAHEWNIIELDGLYYNADVTWDASNAQAGWNYDWFLLSMDAFVDHHRDAVYLTDSFVNSYPMSPLNYQPGSDATTAGCGMREEDVYNILIALQDDYPEGMPWDNSNSYSWNINYTIGYGCAALAFLFSDAAFGYLPSRTIYEDISIDDLRVGDILRLYGDSHSAVVLEVNDDHIVIVEGNFNASVHWGRQLHDYEIAEDVTYYQTRYPEHTFRDGVCVACGAAEENTDAPDTEPTPDTWPKTGECGNDVIWSLDSEGKLTISGTGDTWHYPEEYPSFFEYADMITECVIEEGVTSIGYYLFFELRNMERVSIAASVTDIGHYAFGDCMGLRNVEFLGDAPYFGDEIFRNVTAEIYYPSGNATWNDVVGSTFGGILFWMIQGTDEVTWPIIGTCGEMTRWSLNADGVLTITGTGDTWDYPVEYPGWYTYRNILTTVVIESGVTSIGDFLFYECPNVSSVTIPDTVADIGVSAFNGCCLAGVTIPDSVTRIATGAFKRNRMEEVTIPASVRVIDEAAFAECDWLRKIVFLGDAPQIHSIAFDYVKADCYYPGNNATWTADMFRDYGAYQLTWVNSGSENPTPDIIASGYCGDYVTWVLDRNGLMTISGTGSTWDYTGNANTPWNSVWQDVKTVVIEPGVTDIGNFIFSACFNLTGVEIPSSVTQIGEFAFDGLRNLRDVTLPEGLTDIGTCAFYGCVSLTEMHIPSTVDDIAPAVFGGCTNLTSITVSGDNQTFCSVDGVVYNRSMTELAAMPGGYSQEYILPESITAVGQGDFYGCALLPAVVLHDNVTAIDAFGFYQCSSLASITIPASVEWIGMEAFLGCYALKSITFEGDVPEMSYDVFTGVTATAYYPAENPTWTDAARASFTGNLTWEPIVPAGLPGDVDGSGEVDIDDAIYVLFHVLVGADMYPISGSCDFDGSGSLDVEDAIYLLFYILVGADFYPLY